MIRYTEIHFYEFSNIKLPDSSRIRWFHIFLFHLLPQNTCHLWSIIPEANSIIISFYVKKLIHSYNSNHFSI